MHSASEFKAKNIIRSRTKKKKAKAKVTMGEETALPSMSQSKDLQTVQLSGIMQMEVAFKSV
eukprot:2468799-Amphidinium_carterae.1